ncbi:site-specific integrase [Vreelandella rituensis]|uniref:Site-specific integrase n=1 Tax=Vreelandella rituensis TaxID=2282306 RepID=A0A368U6N3_9GAMM|nr:site-specific integrase [Halomonas rituensis]RCV92176.1 site-specific integrase [Halomonas rituensis]
MALLNAARLIGQWKEEKNSLVQPSQIDDTAHILHAALGDIPVKALVLVSHDTRELIADLFEWRQATGRAITRQQAHKRVNRVLAALNEVPSMQAILIPEPVPVHRPTAHPPTPRTFLLYEQMVTLERHLLSWCRRDRGEDAWLLVLALRLMTRLGMSETVVLGSLAALTHQHVDGRHWDIPASPDAKWPHDGHYRLTLPDDLWVPMRAIISRAKAWDRTAWLLAPSAEAEARDHTQRRQQLRTQLKVTSQRCLKALQHCPDSEQWHSLRSWSSLVSASRYVTVMRGVPPLWATLLRQYPLPTCTPVPLLADSDTAHRYAPGESQGRLPTREAVRNKTPAPLPDIGQQTRPAGVSVITTTDFPPDWQRRVKNLLQQFLAEAARLSPKKVTAKKYEEPMRKLLVRYEKRLDRLIGHSGHYLGWVLQFLYHQLRTEGNKLSTARTQLSRLTPLTMLMHEAVLDLHDWDDEVVMELQIDAQSGSQWSATTLERFKASFRQFMRFCQRHGMLEEVTLPQPNAGSLAPSVLRTRILSPDHMQMVWETLTRQVPSGDPRQMMGLVIALGFYAGLRASEVESLTLNSVIFGAADEQGHRTCWVEILGGKTAAARRRIALHVMAPAAVVVCLHEWVEERLTECSKWSLAEVALFGPRHSPQTFTRASLITPVIEWMRYLLGDDIDFHGLRHAAVSWTLLRLHAAQHPSFRDTLQHRHHWMFQPQTLQMTLSHFCGAEAHDTLARGTLLLQVAKWIGHREPGTLLENYAHTLGLIHSDILAPKAK